MKKLFLIAFLSILCTGCSFLPHLTTDTPNTLPQSVDKSKVKESCTGETKFNDAGDITYCAKGYYNYEEGYHKIERKMTIVEKIKSFINGLVGWGFIGFILLIILVPGSLGWVLSRMLDATHKAFDQTISAIKQFRKTSSAKEELDNILRAEQDAQTKKIIAEKRVE
jgi:hypothetical protein